MNNFVCKICNYTTKRQANYDRHINSKKHDKKVITSYKSSNVAIKSQPSPNQVPPKSHLSICQYCSRGFARPDTLTKHMKSCLDKLQTEKGLEDQIKNLNTKLNEFEVTVKQYKKDAVAKDKETTHYKEEVDYYKQMLREAGGLVKKSVSSLTYAMDNYTNAPALKTITMQEISTFEDPVKKIVEDILSSYKHKTLGRYLGDFILKIHKKDDPKDQSIWNTDDNRLTYLIKELLNNKASTWIVDKKGIKTKTYLIEPILAHIKKLLLTYQTDYGIPVIGLNSVELEMLLENSKKLLELTNDIDDGVIAKDILKHISSHLKFSGNFIT